MTRRRQRNNGNKKTRSLRGGELTLKLKETVNTDINTLLSQYFSGENLDQTLITKYASNIELKEFTPIYKNYSSISQTPNYLNALEKYGGIRSTELDVISFSSSLNAVTTALGVASMGLIVSMQAATFAGNEAVVGTIGIASASTISSATTSVITAIGGATALALTATGLGLIVLFGLVSTMVYVSNLYLKEKELQELSRLIVGVCEYIKNDAHIIHMFYKNTNTALPAGAKLASLLKQLYNLMFKTLSYFPKEYFYDAYKNYLNTENVALRIAELNQVYNVYNTKDNYLKCNENNIDILLQTGNFLLYRYIFVRLCIIDKQRYLNDSNNFQSEDEKYEKITETTNYYYGKYNSNGINYYIKDEYGIYKQQNGKILSVNGKLIAKLNLNGNPFIDCNNCYIKKDHKKAAEKEAAENQEKKANNDSQSGGDRFDTKNFATSVFGKFLSSASNTASNTASNFGSSLATGIKKIGNKISTNETLNSIGIPSGVKNYYSRYRKYFRPIAEVEKEYNVSITQHIPSKPFIEQTVSSTANSSFLYSGEQFRQLLGDYAIMDTTYTMSVTKYVFDFNTYVIKNMGNSDKLKSAVPSNVTHADQILTALVGTKYSEGRIIETPETNYLKEKIAVMLYPLLAEKVYNEIFGVFKQKIRQQIITDTAVNTARLIQNSALSKLINPDAKDVANSIINPISKNDINVSIAQSDTQPNTQPNTPPGSQPNTPPGSQPNTPPGSQPNSP